MNDNKNKYHKFNKIKTASGEKKNVNLDCGRFSWENLYCCEW